MAKIGSFVDGKYEILKKIGQGGMSTVYLAMDKRLNKQWAVKEIEKNGRDANNDVIIQSSIAEANMIKKLDHPALPRIVDIIDDQYVIYVIMDYIEGEPLSKILNDEGAQPQELVLDWAKQLLEVLEYLHTRSPAIIYRDMKPANIMLKPDGKIKLIDFGIAREYKEHNVADTVCLGTKGYAAPEQYGSRGQTDARTDIYGFGVTLYSLLTGKNPSEPPYEIYPIRYWNPNLSGGLENIILKCTKLDPNERFQSCPELIYAVEHMEESDDYYKRMQWKKFRNSILILSLSILLLVVGIIGNVLKINGNNKDYENLIFMADKVSSEEEKIQFYKKAIDLKPYEVSPYLELLVIYKSDVSFSIDEESDFKNIINPNLTNLKDHKNYAKLAFEIGKMYWYYYDYGKTDKNDNQITRMKSSIMWFGDAIDYGNKTDNFYEMSLIYQNIGKFNQEIVLNIEEASDKGKYKPYFENLTQLVNLVQQSESDTEITRLELFKLVISTIENYSRKFKNDDITSTELESLLENVKNSTLLLETTTEKTEQMKKYILERYQSSKDAISNAYLK